MGIHAYIHHKICVACSKVDSQFIDDDVWRPDLLHREGDPGHTVTLIRVPHQELVLPVLVWNIDRSRPFRLNTHLSFYILRL